MSFDLKVVFTGLMVFVPNGCQNSRARMCALVVDGRQEDRFALDGTQLRPHRAFVRFPIDNLSPTSGAKESFGLWYLDRQRIIFDIESEDDDKPGVAFGVRALSMAAGSVHPEEPSKDDRFSFSWALNLERLSPYFTIDPRLLEASPPEDSVIAQVVIDRGILQTATVTPIVWACDTTLSEQIYNQAFAHEVELVFDSIRAARIRAISFDDPDKVQILDLSSLQRDGRVEISIVNACERNPLQWDITQTPEADVDTKWVFELLDEAGKASVVDRLRKAELPIPRPLRPLTKLGGAPGSGNCIPPFAPRPVYFGVRELDGEDFVCEAEAAAIRREA
jgi:hypothetical protein